jgi:hypothetical protein
MLYVCHLWWESHEDSLNSHQMSVLLNMHSLLTMDRHSVIHHDASGSGSFKQSWLQRSKEILGDLSENSTIENELGVNSSERHLKHATCCLHVSDEDLA